MNTETETRMTQYLLGDLSEAERLRLEEQFFCDDEAFAQLQALEDELHYDYARGGLSRAQRQQFEQRFLSQPDTAQRIALAQAVLQTVAETNATNADDRIITAQEKPTFFRSLIAFFGVQSTGWQVGLAAASLVILLGGVWLFYQTVKLRSQVEQLEIARAEQSAQRRQLEQQATEQRTRGEQLQTQLDAERRQRAELEEQLTRQKAEVARTNESSAPATFLSFLLIPGLSRDIDSTKRLTIPTTVAQIRLQLRLKRPVAYRSYQAILQTPDGATRWQQTVTRPTVTLPTRLVPPGDYVLILKGKTADGQWEDVDEYHFQTARP